MGEMLEGRATASSYSVLLYDDPDCCERHLCKEVDSSIQILLLRQLLEELRRAASDVVISRVGIIVLSMWAGRVEVM